MSTRCNILLKKGKELFQLYHHFDGYWEGVGGKLIKFFSHEYDGEKDLSELAKKLEYFDDEFKPEDEINLHGDIEYVYVVDIKEKEASIMVYRIKTDYNAFTAALETGENIDDINLVDIGHNKNLIEKDFIESIMKSKFGTPAEDLTVHL